MSPSPPSPTVVQHELLACTLPPSQTPPPTLTGTCARPNVTHSSHGYAAQRPPAAGRPARPALPPMTRGTQPTQSAPPCAPGEPIAPVPDGRPARALSVHITSVSDGHPPTTVGTPHQGLVPTLAPGEPIASVSDGRPARVPSVHITSVSDGRPPTTASAPPRGPGTAADATATAASAAGTGMEVGTDPIPAMAAPPTAERISSFLSCIRQSAADDDMATAASAADTLATPLPPDVHMDACGGATANAASSSLDTTVDTAGDDATMPAASAAATLADPPSPLIGAVAQPAPARKRKVRGSCSHVAQDERKRQRRAALLPTTQGDTGAGT